MKKFLSVALILCMVLSVVPFYTIEANAETVYNEVESNDVIGNATPIDITDGAVVKGEFNSEDGYDCDFFKFTLTKGSKVEIKSKYDCSPYTYNMSYDIYYETNFPEIEIASDCTTFISYNENLGYCYGNNTHYLAEGTYYLKLVVTCNGCYSLSFDTVPLEEFSEPNDVISQATDISAGDSYRGIISSKHSGGDFDFFKIYSPEDRSYMVTIDCSISVGDIAFSVFDEEGENIGAIKTEYGDSRKEYIGKGEKKTFEVKLPAGNSYLRLYGYTLAGYNQSGEYTISVSDAGSTDNKGNAKELSQNNIAFSKKHYLVL